MKSNYLFNLCASAPPTGILYTLGINSIIWDASTGMGKKSVLLIPSTAVTDVERSRFLKALSDAASRGDTNGLTVPVEELSDVCRRNRAVQEIVQEALRPLELNMVNVS